MAYVCLARWKSFWVATICETIEARAWSEQWSQLLNVLALTVGLYYQWLFGQPLPIEATGPHFPPQDGITPAPSLGGGNNAMLRQSKLWGVVVCIHERSVNNVFCIVISRAQESNLIVVQVLILHALDIKVGGKQGWLISWWCPQ